MCVCVCPQFLKGILKRTWNSYLPHQSALAKNMKFTSGVTHFSSCQARCNRRCFVYTNVNTTKHKGTMRVEVHKALGEWTALGLTFPDTFLKLLIAIDCLTLGVEEVSITETGRLSSGQLLKIQLQWHFSFLGVVILCYPATYHTGFIYLFIVF